MPNIQGQKKWSTVRLLETHELARGGINGNLNEQAIALADRTEFLNQEKANKSEIVQGVFEFGTYAEFNAVKSTLPLNCTVVIGEENTTGSGQWAIGNNSWNGVILKKSSYDPPTQAKAQIVKGINNVPGKYFANAKYEHDDNSLYVKLNAFNNNAFFIRAANIENAHISLTDATTQLQEYFGSDKYPVTAPSGATGYFKLTNDDCIVYDQDLHLLRGVARSTITPNSNYALMISNDYTQVGLGIERDKALVQIEERRANERVTNGLNNVAGLFFNEPYYEVANDGTIYFKPKSFGATGNAFFIRAANIPNATISLADVITQLSAYYTVDKYPITSPNGVADCFKLSGNDDCIVYDHATGQLKGISRASITLSSNVTIMIARNYTQIGKCVEAAEILKQFESQKRVKDIADLEILTRVFTLADVTNSRTALYTANTPANLKKSARGQILFDTTTKKMHVPQDIIIRKVDKTGTQYRLTEAVDVDFSSVALSYTSIAIFFDNASKTFIPKVSYESITDSEKAKFVLFCIIRSTGPDSTNFAVTANFNYQIDFAQNGEFINKYTAEITDGQHSGSAVRYITYRSDLKALILPRDLILGFNGNTYIVPSDTTINMIPLGSTTASSGQIVYWNLYTNEFVVKQFDTALSVQERYRLVRICNVRDRNLNSGSAIDSSRISLDLGIKHYVDDRPFNLTFSTITEMRLDDVIKAPNHRGYNSIAPENTLPAYSLSKKRGYSYVECDISFTSDNVPVLLHDDTIDRTSNGTGRIRELTLAQVKELDFGSWKSADYTGTRIPTLEEFLQLCHRLNLHPYLELKTSVTLNTTLATQLIDIVRRTGMKGRVSWISFSDYQLNQIKLIDETARLGLVVDTPTTALIAAAVGLKTGSNSVFINSNHANTTKALVQEAITAGIEAEVYSPNNASLIPNLADMGVTGISTDYLNIREILNNSYGV